MQVGDLPQLFDLQQCKRFSERKHLPSLFDSGGGGGVITECECRYSKRDDYLGFECRPKIFKAFSVKIVRIFKTLAQQTVLETGITAAAPFFTNIDQLRANHKKRISSFKKSRCARTERALSRWNAQYDNRRTRYPARRTSKNSSKDVVEVVNWAALNKVAIDDCIRPQICLKLRVNRDINLGSDIFWRALVQIIRRYLSTRFSPAVRR